MRLLQRTEKVARGWAALQRRGRPDVLSGNSRTGVSGTRAGAHQRGHLGAREPSGCLASCDSNPSNERRRLHSSHSDSFIVASVSQGDRGPGMPMPSSPGITQAERQPALTRTPMNRWSVSVSLGQSRSVSVMRAAQSELDERRRQASWPHGLAVPGHARFARGRRHSAKSPTSGRFQPASLDWHPSCSAIDSRQAPLSATDAPQLSAISVVA